MHCKTGRRTRSSKALTDKQEDLQVVKKQSDSNSYAEVVGLSSDDDDDDDHVVIIDQAQGETQQANDSGGKCLHWEEDDQVERRRRKKWKREKNIEFGIKRRKTYGLDLLINENAREEGRCASQRTRSHFQRNKKSLKLGTLSQPICLDDDTSPSESVETDLEEAKTCEASESSEDEEGEGDESSSASEYDRDSEGYARVRKKGRKHLHDSEHVRMFKILQDSLDSQELNPNMDLPNKFSKESTENEEEVLDQLWDEMDSAVNATRCNSVADSPVSWLQEGSGSGKEKSSGSRRESSPMPRKKRKLDLEDFGDSIYGKARDDEMNPNMDLQSFSFTFKTEKPEPEEKSEEEKELDALWVEMGYSLNIQQNSVPDSQVQNNTDSDHYQYPMGEVTRAALCRQGKHHLILDEEIGQICKYCLHVALEIKYYVPPFSENPFGKWNRRDSCSLDNVDQSVINELQHGNAGHDDYNHCDHTGTVWDIIPGVKKTMYPHQCEAFEFLWRNLAGGISLDKLKEQKEFPGASGCIISHAPGTGKTRLTIVFLQTFMKLYPTCRPMIIAPKGILRTWEEEFKTWKVDIPFHNLNNPDYSGMESAAAMNLIGKSVCNVSRRVAMLYCRAVKLCSWKCNKSILGISYPLFVHLTREGSSERRVLLEHPGLLVLDEGHTPRSSGTRLLKAVSEIQTKRRIILSGTPFQNNFNELYNTLCLVRPKFAEWNPSEDEVVFDDKRGSSRNESKGKWAYLTNSQGKVTDDSRRIQILKEIRNMIHPFVHVHQGTILQERLPGLRKLVIILKPTQLQKEIFEEIQRKRSRLVAQGKEGCKKVLKLEHEESLAAVHPALSEGKKLQRFRLNPEEGVKTKFVMELIRLSVLLNERVLVFSQHINPLELLASQLKYHFGWNVGREVLQMQGKDVPKLRQASIKAFNDPRSKVKVMLASIKAFYEGISLVGASRVVLLDVVWNPSVERQAISRAYRLGQKKFVYTYQLITAGTRDEEKFSSQAEKDQLSELVFFNSDVAQNCQNFSSAELEDQILEGMIQQKKFGLIFEKVAINYQETNSTLKEDFSPHLV